MMGLSRNGVANYDFTLGVTLGVTSPDNHHEGAKRGSSHLLAREDTVAIQALPYGARAAACTRTGHSRWPPVR